MMARYMALAAVASRRRRSWIMAKPATTVAVKVRAAVGPTVGMTSGQSARGSRKKPAIPPTPTPAPSSTTLRPFGAPSFRLRCTRIPTSVAITMPTEPEAQPAPPRPMR